MEKRNSHMKIKALASLLNLAMLLAFSLAANAEVLTLAKSKELLHLKNQTCPIIVQPVDPANASNPEYVALANKVNSAFKTCMNPATPLVGSPIGRFYKYRSAQLGDYCDKLTVSQCIDKVYGQQVDFCKQKVKLSNTDSVAQVAPLVANQNAPQAVQAPHVAPKKTIPGQSGNDCDDSKINLQRLAGEKSALEARKKKLETEIIRIFGELAANEAATNRARQEAEKQYVK